MQEKQTQKREWYAIATCAAIFPILGGAMYRVISELTHSSDLATILILIVSFIPAVFVIVKYRKG